MSQHDMSWRSVLLKHMQSMRSIKTEALVIRTSMFRLWVNLQGAMHVCRCHKHSIVPFHDVAEIICLCTTAKQIVDM